MNKLNVFSEKLGKALEVSFREDGILVTTEGIPVTGNGIVLHGIIVPEAGWIRAGITVPAVGRTKVGITALEVG